MSSEDRKTGTRGKLMVDFLKGNVQIKTCRNCNSTLGRERVGVGEKVEDGLCSRCEEE